MCDSFDQWLDYHANRFPQVRSYIANDVTIAATWELILGSYPPEDLQAVTVTMLSSGDDSFASQHASIIDKLARNIQRDRSFVAKAPDDSGERYQCHLCRDYGLRFVYSPEAYQPILDGCFDPAMHLRECTVYCTCDIGYDKHSKAKDNPRTRIVSPRFSMQTMCEIEGVTTVEKVAELKDFVLNHFQRPAVQGLVKEAV